MHRDRGGVKRVTLEDAVRQHKGETGKKQKKTRTRLGLSSTASLPHWEERHACAWMRRMGRNYWIILQSRTLV